MLYTFGIFVCVLCFAIYKVNWICFLTSQRLKRSWADSTFNIYLCDAALWCLLSYPMLCTHKFIYFPPFFPVVHYVIFTVWLQKNDFSFHKWSFHSNINIICRLICYWFSLCLVLGFFLWSKFLCPACWNNNKVFSYAIYSLFPFFIFPSQYQYGRPNGITEMMNNTIYKDYQIHFT